MHSMLMSGLRLSDLNKETTYYLLTYNLTPSTSIIIIIITINNNVKS